MMMPMFAKLLLALVLMVSLSPDARGACRIVRHLGADYAVCDVDPATASLTIFHADEAGRPYGGFTSLKTDLLRDQTRLDFAMNGGMYEKDLSPVGLLVIDGVERKPIATGEGWGNFYLLPNGVFALSNGKAIVRETEAYRRSVVATPDVATQSGPMLVIDGALHPAFKPQSDSLQIRNGVGVDEKGLVHFAVALSPVRFHDFATLYRDALGCPNALFLDGHISSLYAPDLGRIDETYPMGPIIAVTTPMWHGAVLPKPAP
ncbi:uncharacterized protein YigE (DUF2233 family) [Rhizobium sp. PP-F2F-G38]|nr:uncharacterized protein YigE (DUF2233 family) [Rhizobium sp. PP-WC-1G-195]PYF00720.1 uncharacterized protein YigE (DUF2233 family) [Rhizobium sp. PP-F2F-G38]TCP90595.1 uncharacterized protein YigE (DUF2233 family) [Rhizobium sp. PP-CC-2G-626]